MKQGNIFPKVQGNIKHNWEEEEIIPPRLPFSFSIGSGIPEVCSNVDKLGKP